MRANKHALLYTVIITLNAILVALEALLVAGAVPLPAACAWVTPCLVAGLTVLTTQLPRLVPEGQAPPPASPPAAILPTATGERPATSPPSPAR